MSHPTRIIVPLLLFTVWVTSASADGPVTSHKGLFYANDFGYLLEPYADEVLGDQLKLLEIADGTWGSVDIGGQHRMRYHSEIGMGRENLGTTPRFENTNNDFLLYRLRLYTNWQINDCIRLYTEGIYAETTKDGGDYVPRVIDRNRGDFLNLFADVKLTESCTVRVGRQELLYGNQRLVSPLDWANTRRTFDGVRVLGKSENASYDVFYTHFVPVVFNEFDEADSEQMFYGYYGSYEGYEFFTIDTYYLGYNNDNAGADFSVHTLGLRVNGSMGDWLWEFEGGPQFGRQRAVRGGVDQRAGFCTAGIGRKVNKLPGGTTIWFYYDYASGDDGNGNFNAFNDLFPLGHKYLGFIDAVQRSNIESPNILLTAKPGEKWNFLLWYWHFMSNTTAPVQSLGNTPSQNTSKDLGDELDIIFKYTFCPRTNLLFGWSHFWRGSKINGPQDADFIYTQWEVNF